MVCRVVGRGTVPISLLIVIFLLGDAFQEKPKTPSFQIGSG